MFNLNEQEPEIADKMLRKIEWWRQSVDAQAPEVNPDFESR
jgi:hypothetical protein